MARNADSPSKHLSETLESFHISSPGGAQDQVRKQAKEGVGKRYMANEYFGEGEGRPGAGVSYLRRLSEWSMNYGTVQVGEMKQRHKENVEEDGEEAIGGCGEEGDAQWKQYMRAKRQQRGSPVIVERGGQAGSQLVVTTSLSDISIEPGENVKGQCDSFSEGQLALSSNRTESHLSEDAQMDYGSEDDDEDEDDEGPAEAAKSIFDKVLRGQRSNFFGGADDELQLGARQSARAGARPDSLSDDSSSSFQSEPLSPTMTGSHTESNQAKLKLITPEDAGMVFDHQRGVWEPLTELELRRSSAANLDGSQTVNTTLLYESEPVESVTPKQTPRSISTYHDTPLAPPRLADKFRLPQEPQSANNYKPAGTGGSAKLHNAIFGAQENHAHDRRDITDIANLDTSFSLSQSAVVRVLLDVIPNKQDWANVDTLDLGSKALVSLIGLDQLTPNCTTLDVSQNDLNSLQGVPTGCIFLTCSANNIGSYASLKHLLHLEQLDLSMNKLTHQNLSLLGPCYHLKLVNLSHNKISGLRHLPEKVHLQKLNLANNILAGKIDFQELCAESASWSHLEELDLSNNKITCIENIATLAKLRVLRLDGNPIAALSGAGTSQIRVLTLTNNPSLKTIEGFPRLRIFKCRGESLHLHASSLPDSLEVLEIFGGSKDASDAWNWNDMLPRYLRALRLRKMQLSALPPAIAHLPLRSLDVAYNCLTSTTQLIQALPPTLKELNISGNPLWAVSDADKYLLIEAVKLYIFVLRGAA